MQEIKRIGLIGLGKMGLPIGRHLAAKGFEVAGYDTSLAAVKAAASAGMQPVNSAKSAATGSELVIVAVGFDSEVEAVLFGDNGIMAGAEDGLIVAVASTVAPRTMRRLAERCGDRKVTLLDIPLCRGEPAAEAGKLLIMGGGDKEAFDACRPAFGAFADAVFHLGVLGAGQVGKMVNNLLLWACTCANDEGLGLAQKLGVETEALREALMHSSGANWALQTRPEERPMPWAEKDMMIVLSEADAVRLSVPVCGVVKEAIKSIKIARGLATPHAPE